MTTGYVDPGTRKGAVAFFDAANELVYAATLRASNPAGLARLIVERAEAHGVTELVVEKMEKYAHARSKHKDLDAVEDMVDLLKQRFKGRIRRRKPFAWKRNCTKKVCAARTKLILSSEELANCVDQGHDAMDAVGIGLVELGRAGPGVVPLKKRGKRG